MSGEPERPAELADIQGSWRRDGRRLHDGPWDEISDVLWLQVGVHFCDLRTAYAGTVPSHGLDLAQAFSGTIDVAHGDITFHHDLDSLDRDPAHPDVSTVHRVAEAMYERGPGFEERWVLASLPDDDGAVAELPAADGGALARIVRVGALALAVWGGRTPGGARYTAPHGWAPEPATPGERGVADADEAVHALAFGGPLPGSWQSVTTMPS
ncbi:MAG TPA: hypothetical protein VG346_07560 [Acidimicrobiales bacterium]|nr:hypothetical protein [Acidimicrobiales bacterium]